jgi:chromosome segregation ATPase
LHKETARQARGAVKELEREISRLTKIDNANTKKLDTTSNELEEVGKQNRRFKEDHKELSKKLKAAEKRVQENLELKYQHERKKAELAVEKERLALKRARETRRKASATLDKQQQNKKDLIEEKKRAAISLTVARKEHKTKKQKSRVDQAAERINTANMMHMATNGRFPTPNEATAAAAAAATAAISAGGRTDSIAAAASTGNISEVSTLLFVLLFLYF